MPLAEYQQNLRGLLEARFQSATVCEWRTRMNVDSYSPRLDVAVGPFSLANGIMLTQEHDALFNANELLIRRLIKTHLINLAFLTDNASEEEAEALIQPKLEDIRHFNYNSRCFLAVEIENSVSRKHLMGGAINASVLGRIGIAIGYTAEMHTSFLNLYRYFAFLQSVDKPTFRTNNLLIMSSDQIIAILNEEV